MNICVTYFVKEIGNAFFWSKITFADYAIQNELETDIISDQYDSVKELLDDIEKMTYAYRCHSDKSSEVSTRI